MARFVEVDFNHDDNDFQDSDMIVRILKYLANQILFQLRSEMFDDLHPRAHQISIEFRTRENIKTAVRDALEEPNPDTCSFVTGGVAVLAMPMFSRGKSHIISTDVINLGDFAHLLEAKVLAVDPQTLELFGHKKPVFDLRRLNQKTVQLVRDDLLKRMYHSIFRVYKYLNFDSSHLKRCYGIVKNRKWIFEEEIGSAAFSRGKEKRKAQLFRRWKGQFVYSIARITEIDGRQRDFIFDVLWKPASIDNETGRLVWVNKHKLKYAPKYDHSTILIFDVDGPDVEFSFMEKPWEKPREAGFNIRLTDMKNRTENSANLNF